MKKRSFILVLLGFILLVGCTLGNTPTSRVEALLSDYQMLEDNILISYFDLTGDTTLNQDMQDSYEDVIKKQYRDFSYEVREEVIDGELAVVTVEIEVMNYKNAINKYDKTAYDTFKYHELVLDELANTKDMVTYTIDFTLTKGDNDNWEVDALTDEIKDKLLGIY